ncbi:hypothetical protein LCGC14_2280730, partial [marine sediment metagenome]
RTFNDFDPCWLPNGRVAFVSERCGGYLRCGRVCTTYTLHDMAADGSDIKRLSYHETHEWQPSVSNDGKILYTRWDYIDRWSSAAHLPWITTPDGRDPREIHGNFVDRMKRPDMEVDVRAIPGSHKFIATATGHHSQTVGTLVMIDPRMEDGEQMKMVKRITPDVGFPENQVFVNGACPGDYGEAWPLNEDYYLCVYDHDAKIPANYPLDADYGIYLVDSFGNRELLYRDPEISSHNPIPLRPRPMPPVIPDGSIRVAKGEEAEATVGLIDVYNSSQTMPEDTKITALRVYQVLPLSVASFHTRHSIGLQIPGTNSVNIARAVLGTVPVEEDGSAFFTVPANKELFFQALDENGMAVQTMRSGTHFMPGENTTCQGCHEPQSSAGTVGKSGEPLAMRREPSRLKEDVDGTNPFSYPRLVQPVLDRNCVECHEENKDTAPSLDSEVVRVPGNGWMSVPTAYYASYMSLAPAFGTWYYSSDFSISGYQEFVWQGKDVISPVGQVGAKASKLYPLLKDGHYDVELSDEDMHRIIVWLDSYSPFYGVYEPEGGQAQLRGEVAYPTLE